MVSMSRGSVPIAVRMTGILGYILRQMPPGYFILSQAVIPGHE